MDDYIVKASSPSGGGRGGEGSSTNDDNTNKNKNNDDNSPGGGSGVDDNNNNASKVAEEASGVGGVGGGGAKKPKKQQIRQLKSMTKKLRRSLSSDDTNVTFKGSAAATTGRRQAGKSGGSPSGGGGGGVGATRSRANTAPIFRDVSEGDDEDADDDNGDVGEAYAVNLVDNDGGSGDRKRPSSTPPIVSETEGAASEQQHQPQQQQQQQPSEPIEKQQAPQPVATMKEAPTASSTRQARPQQELRRTPSTGSEEEDEDIRIAKAMAMAIANNPGMSPDEIRKLVGAAPDQRPAAAAAAGKPSGGGGGVVVGAWDFSTAATKMGESIRTNMLETTKNIKASTNKAPAFGNIGETLLSNMKWTATATATATTTATTTTTTTTPASTAESATAASTTTGGVGGSTVKGENQQQPAATSTSATVSADQPPEKQTTTTTTTGTKVAVSRTIVGPANEGAARTSPTTTRTASPGSVPPAATGGATGVSSAAASAAAAAVTRDSSGISVKKLFSRGKGSSPRASPVPGQDSILVERSALAPTRSEVTAMSADTVSSEAAPAAVAPASISSSLKRSNSGGSFFPAALRVGLTSSNEPTVGGKSPPIRLSGMAWKRRGGMGKYSATGAWELRRIELVGTKLLYYQAASDELEAGEMSVASRSVTSPKDQPDSLLSLASNHSASVADDAQTEGVVVTKRANWLEQATSTWSSAAAHVDPTSPRGCLDLAKEKATVNAAFGHTGAPSPFALSIKVRGETKWKLCFDRHQAQMEWLAAISDVVVQGSVDVYNAQLLAAADPGNQDAGGTGLRYPQQRSGASSAKAGAVNQLWMMEPYRVESADAAEDSSDEEDESESSVGGDDFGSFSTSDRNFLRAIADAVSDRKDAVLSGAISPLDDSQRRRIQEAVRDTLDIPKQRLSSLARKLRRLADQPERLVGGPYEEDREPDVMPYEPLGPAATGIPTTSKSMTTTIPSSARVDSSKDLAARAKAAKNCDRTWGIPERNLMYLAATLNGALFSARASSTSMEGFWYLIGFANLSLYLCMSNEPHWQSILTFVRATPLLARASIASRRASKRKSSIKGGEELEVVAPIKPEYIPVAGSSTVRLKNPTDPPVNSKNQVFAGWCTPPGSIMQVRSHGYLATKGKVPSPGELYECVSVDIFESPSRYPDMASRVKLPVCQFTGDGAVKTWHMVCRVLLSAVETSFSSFALCEHFASQLIPPQHTFCSLTSSL